MTKLKIELLGKEEYTEFKNLTLALEYLADLEDCGDISPMSVITITVGGENE